MIRYILVALGVSIISAVTVIQAFAADVTMRIRNGDLTIRGAVLDFDGKTYRLQTGLFGEVNLDVEHFECISGPCKKNDTVSAPTSTAQSDFGFHGSKLVGRYLIPFLIGGYAQSIDVSAILRASDDISKLKVDLIDKNESKLAVIDVVTNGSGAAVSALANGEVSVVGISSRRMNEAEAQLLPSVREHLLAHDGLRVIVSPQNPLSEISREQLKSVFDGTITDWSQLGVVADRIKVYARNERSQPDINFNSLVLGGASDQLTPDVRRYETDAELAEAVAGDPLAIGFTRITSNDSAKVLAISSSCGLTHAPTAFAVKAGEYPLAHDLYLYAGAQLGAEYAKGFLSYSLSDSAQQIISLTGFIDRSLQQMPYQELVSHRVSSVGNEIDRKLEHRLFDEIKSLGRLSTTLRFNERSFELDVQSQRDIVQLASLLSDDALRGKKVLLLGFSDAGDTFEKGRETSVLRANIVKAEILKAADGRIQEFQLETKGYGQLMPVGCDDNPVGRSKNRRVEVWTEPNSVSITTSNVVGQSIEHTDRARSSLPLLIRFRHRKGSGTR